MVKSEFDRYGVSQRTANMNKYVFILSILMNDKASAKNEFRYSRISHLLPSDIFILFFCGILILLVTIETK